MAVTASAICARADEIAEESTKGRGDAGADELSLEKVELLVDGGRSGRSAGRWVQTNTARLQ